jgi:hypothetical protein
MLESLESIKQISVPEPSRSEVLLAPEKMLEIS